METTEGETLAMAAIVASVWERGVGWVVTKGAGAGIEGTTETGLEAAANKLLSLAMVAGPIIPVPLDNLKGVKISPAYCCWKAAKASLVLRPKYAPSWPGEPTPEIATRVAPFWFKKACKQVTSGPADPTRNAR